MIPPPSHAGSSALLTPERVAASTSMPRGEKIGEMCRQFEAVLLRQILAETTRPAVKSGLTAAASGADAYHDLAVNGLADEISRTGAFGLADNLRFQLDRQLGSAAHGNPALHR